MSARASVRIATPADAEAVGALLTASYSTLMQAGYDPRDFAAVLPKITSANPALLESGRYYLASVDDGVAAGCGGWSFARPGTREIEPGLAHIRHFAVHPDCAGRGVGRALFEACEAAARQAGASRFECYSSLNAEGFYASLGFVRVGPIDVPMGGGLVLASIIMTRKIAQSI